MIVWPIGLLGLVGAAFLATLATDRLRARRRACELYSLAREARMNYSPLDRFDLASRLRQRGDWLTDTTDLVVRDVLYSARDDERHFLVTASRRHTVDQRPKLYVVACKECLHRGDFTAQPRVLTSERDVVDTYREMMRQNESLSQSPLDATVSS